MKYPDGLRLRDPNLGIQETIALIAPIMRNYVREAKIDIVADEYLAVIDTYKPVNAAPQEILWTVLRRRYDERKIRLGVNHPDHDPLRFSIVFGHTSQGTLLYPYVGQALMLAHLRNNLPDLFESYGYGDNTEKPRHVSTEQWLDRKHAWETLQGEDNTLLDLPMWTLSAKESYPFNLMIPGDYQTAADKRHPQTERLQRALVQLAMNAMAKDPRIKNLLGQKARSHEGTPTILQRDAQVLVRTILDDPAQQNLLKQSLPEPFPGALSRWKNKPSSALASVMPELKVRIETLAAHVVNSKFK